MPALAWTGQGKVILSGVDTRLSERAIDISGKLESVKCRDRIGIVAHPWKIKQA